MLPALDPFVAKMRAVNPTGTSGVDRMSISSAEIQVDQVLDDSTVTLIERTAAAALAPVHIAQCLDQPGLIIIRVFPNRTAHKPVSFTLAGASGGYQGQPQQPPGAAQTTPVAPGRFTPQPQQYYPYGNGAPSMGGQMPHGYPYPWPPWAQPGGAASDQLKLELAVLKAKIELMEKAAVAGGDRSGDSDLSRAFMQAIIDRQVNDIRDPDAAMERDLDRIERYKELFGGDDEEEDFEAMVAKQLGMRVVEKVGEPAIDLAGDQVKSMGSAMGAGKHTADDRRAAEAELIAMNKRRAAEVAG